MEHRDYVYKWLSYTLVSLLFILVQCFGLVHLRVWGVHPFIFPVLVSTVAALETAHESAIYTLALGLLMDLTMPGVLPCFYTVAFLVVFDIALTRGDGTTLTLIIAVLLGVAAALLSK